MTATIDVETSAHRWVCDACGEEHSVLFRGGGDRLPEIDIGDGCIAAVGHVVSVVMGWDVP